jgi:hypothetical protein
MRGGSFSLRLATTAGTPASRIVAGAVVLCVAIGGLAGARPAGKPAGEEAAFLAQNQAAMDRMMAAMQVKPTGNVDRDFVDAMVPHHQGAIDMAVAVLQYGRNEKVRRLAQEIIVDQQQEIAAMRLAVGEPLPPSAPAPTASGSDPTAADAAKR